MAIPRLAWGLAKTQEDARNLANTRECSITHAISAGWLAYCLSSKAGLLVTIRHWLGGCPPAAGQRKIATPRKGRRQKTWFDCGKTIIFYAKKMKIIILLQ